MLEQRRGKRDSWGSLITADQGGVASGAGSTSSTSGANEEDNAIGDGSSTGDTAIAGECGADTIVTAATSNADSADAAAPGGENDGTDEFSVSLGMNSCSAADVDDDGDDDGDSDGDEGDGWEDVGGDGGGEGHSDNAAWEKVGVEDGPSPTFEYDEATMGGMRPPPFSLPRVFVDKDRVQVSWVLSGRQRRRFSVLGHQSSGREMEAPRACLARFVFFDHAKGVCS